MNEVTDDHGKTECCGGSSHSEGGVKASGCALGQNCGCAIRASEAQASSALERTYDFTFKITQAAGLIGSGYLGVNGAGVMNLKATDGSASLVLVGREFQLTGTVTSAAYANGTALGTELLSKLTFGPRTVKYCGPASEFAGDGWKALANIHISDDLSTVLLCVTGTGVGFKRFAVNGIELDAIGKAR